MSRTNAVILMAVIILQGFLLLLWTEVTPEVRRGTLAVTWVAAGWVLYRVVMHPHSTAEQTDPFLRWIMQQIPGGFVTIDREYKITYMNAGALAMLAETRPEISDPIGKDARPIIDALGYPPEESPLLRALAEGNSVHNVKLTNFEGRIFLVNAAPLIHPASQERIGAASYFQEITEEELASQQAREWAHRYQAQTAYLNTLLDSLPISVMAIDTKERFTVVNNAAAAYFPKWTKEQLLGANVKEVYLRNGNPPEELRIVRSLRGETIRDVQVTYKGLTFHTHTYPIYDLDGTTITGAVGIYQDVTEWERMRREWSERERLHLAGQLAAGITHEIRNPLAVMKGFIQMLKEKGEAAQHRYYDIILNELDRANSIINDYLSLTKLEETEQAELRQLNEVIEALSPLLSADANLKGMVVRLALDPDLPLFMMNEKEIKQLILNLASNGLDAMDEGGILTIATSRRNDSIEMRIADTGCGMDEQQLRRIFEPFYTTKESGTGLGLATSLAIAERHGFRLRVDSEPGGGTTFICRFPLKP